jgi:pyruvate,water dikinase
MSEQMDVDYIKWFEELRSTDVGLVGGKNSSLGEMISQLSIQGIPVPPGFATTSSGVYAYFVHMLVYVLYH